MKKLLILALVALVASSAFAMTDPAFSGEFDFYTAFDFGAEAAEFGDSGEATINLNGVVDEFSTVNAELSADAAAAVELNQFTLTTDITGALGVDGPVGVSITWGYQSFEGTIYSDVAGYSDTGFSDETGSYVGMTLAITVNDMITINTFIAPGTYTDWDGTNEPSGAVEVLFAMDAISAGVWFAVDGNVGPAEAGFTGSYVTDMLEVGLGAEYDWTVDGGETFRLGLGFLYNISDAWAAGLAYGTTNMLDGAFAATTGVALNTTYALTDMFSVYASFGLSNFEAIEFGLDAGVEVALGGVTYTLGYDYNGADFKSGSGDWTIATEGLYFKVHAEF